MAKFQYKMRNILDIKRKLEDSAKMEFAEANMRVLEEEEKLETIVMRKLQYEEEGKRLRSDELSVADIKNNVQAISVLQELIRQQEKEVQRAKAIQEQKRLLLQEAMQERKTQEKLYENALEVFIQEENAKESKEVDELVSYVYGKRTREQT